jgi:hypothetical protein
MGLIDRKGRIISSSWDGLSDGDIAAQYSMLGFHGCLPAFDP